ncbi:hypothetical protein B0H14DRAFT_2649393 [Mycena olivaceomarginata]|nr:hypothetical protein B0H14DRAFT_2649393 [Mycena olivaceomarginata]
MYLSQFWKRWKLTDIPAGLQFATSVFCTPSSHAKIFAFDAFCTLSLFHATSPARAPWGKLQTLALHLKSYVIDTPPLRLSAHFTTPTPPCPERSSTVAPAADLRIGVCNERLGICTTCDISALRAVGGCPMRTGVMEFLLPADAAAGGARSTGSDRAEIFPVWMQLLTAFVLVQHVSCADVAASESRRLQCTQRTIQLAMLVGGDFLRADAATASARAQQWPGVRDYAGRYRLGCHGGGCSGGSGAHMPSAQRWRVRLLPLNGL